MYWDELEFDFQTQFGLRAMDWIAGKKDWREFYRFKARLGQGTEYFAAVVNDPVIAQQMADEMDANRFNEKPAKGSKTPPVAGWFPWRDELADLKDHLIALRAAQTGAKPHEIQFTPRPVYLVEEIRRAKARKRLRKATSLLLPHQKFENIDTFDLKEDTN